MTTTTVRAADGARLSVQLGGPDDAPPLLLLPGQANSHRWWDGLREGFEDRYRTVTFDYRGTGHTHSEPGDWSTTSFAADAVDVLDALGHPSARVYGTSMGGRVAQMLAAYHPDRVDRLVLAATSPGGPYARERSQQVRRSLADPNGWARRQALADLFYTPAGQHRAAESRLFGDPTMTPQARRAHLRVSDAHDASSILGRITAPTLVLHGSDDLMVPVENAELIAAWIPDATMRIHDGGRHGFFDEFAAEVTPIVRAFLAPDRER
ncbi:Pimeloyl-ACP methyl ester carboxylesterase [Micromonospora pallida]|uniref:Pimeloyl-ACP methyl ester carboxylesterase n=1 Tax=Micromonospora pallida TaxID=145854 RepID=A0A1C6RXG5_9ACTN|nr:alpha/beta hydrolase [Micromonospora pallida]SCL21721.1 Pimeloyl-ACP methyl ester carboxylesterase [Micromonospora pallida]